MSIEPKFPRGDFREVCEKQNVEHQKIMLLQPIVALVNIVFFAIALIQLITLNCCSILAGCLSILLLLFDGVWIIMLLSWKFDVDRVGIYLRLLLLVPSGWPLWFYVYSYPLPIECSEVCQKWFLFDFYFSIFTFVVNTVYIIFVFKLSREQ